MRVKSEVVTELSISETEVRQQLRLLVTSETFKGSKRCLTFLEYVVAQRLAGLGENLREKVIGVEAFGRSAGYDSNDDPVVRVTAGEVRKRLAQYYQEPRHAGELRIDLVAGSYVPEFHPALEPSVLEPVASVRPRRHWWMVLAALVIAGIGWRWLSVPSAFDRFWEPSLATNGPILISTGQSRVYNFRKQLATRVETMLDPEKTGKAPHTLPEGFEIAGQDVIPIWDRYVPLGDAVAMTNMAIFLQGRKHEYRIRGSSETRLTDLREGAAVLFGAHSNDWTLRMNKDLRFRLELSPDGRRLVVEGQAPGQRRWMGPPVNGPYDPEYNDYAILSRIFDKTTGHPVISVGGITHHSTQAAGEFLLSPTLMNEALANAPKGWESKSVQIVVTTKVIGSSASPPQFLALHVW